MKQRLVRAERPDGARSRRAILDAASKLATVEGLEGLSIGRLAEHIGMSKSGLYAHFGSKEELQLATVEKAAEIFDADVIQPAESIQDPLAKVEALCVNFTHYLERKVFPGGCFFITTATEFATRPGPVRDSISALHRDWLRRLESLLTQAREAGQIGSGEDATQLTFELEGFLLIANMDFVLYDDPRVLERCRRAVHALLERARAPSPNAVSS